VVRVFPPSTFTVNFEFYYFHFLTDMKLQPEHHLKNKAHSDDAINFKSSIHHLSPSPQQLTMEQLSPRIVEALCSFTPEPMSSMENNPSQDDSNEAQPQQHNNMIINLIENQFKERNDNKEKATEEIVLICKAISCDAMD